MPIVRMSEKSMALLIKSANQLGVSVKDVLDSVIYESLGKTEEETEELEEAQEEAETTEETQDQIIEEQEDLISEEKEEPKPTKTGHSKK